jgi:hypothetical protein
MKSILPILKINADDDYNIIEGLGTIVTFFIQLFISATIFVLLNLLLLLNLNFHNLVKHTHTYRNPYCYISLFLTTKTYYFCFSSNVNNALK